MILIEFSGKVYYLYYSYVVHAFSEVIVSLSLTRYFLNLTSNSNG